MPSTQRELDCLNDLVLGRDVWPRFWDLYGSYVYYELRALSIDDEHLRKDIYHELVLKLIKDNHAILRGFLAQPREYSFAALLRVMTRNQGISHLRRQKRIRLLEDHELALTPAKGGPWAGDPAANHEAGELLLALLNHACPGKDNSDGFRIMYLRFGEQESVNAIAEALRMKPNTVSQRIRYYLNRLRQQYGLLITEQGSE